MTTPIDTLIDALEQRRAQQIKVVSIDFVLSMIERERQLYPSKAPERPRKGSKVNLL